MGARKDLFRERKIYNLKKTEKLFIEAVRENVMHHEKKCEFYKNFLKSKNFQANDIKKIEDCYNIPPIHANFFKHNLVLSIEKEDMEIHATSSGTKGQKTQMYFDSESVKTLMKMGFNCALYNKFISPIPVKYVMLCYEPTEGNELGAIKTAMAASRLAPALSREFILKTNGNEYEINKFGVINLLKKSHKSIVPVRFIGFPAYMYLVLNTLKDMNIRLKLNKKSRVFLGGGWKQFADQSIDKITLYEMIEEFLGIPKENCRDLYSAVEHNVAYVECKNHHFHTPIWSRVIIRDVKTLEPLGYGEKGFLSFVTPLVLSAPCTSVVMGDLAIMKEGNTCGCGIESPYFEVLGRAGIGSGKNCAVSASELMGVMK